MRFEFVKAVLVKSQFVCFLHHIDWKIVSDGSEECSACFFGVKQSNNTLLGLFEPQSRDIKFFRNVGNYLSA
jgi:hypothetical protein